MFKGILSREWKHRRFPGISQPVPDIDSLYKTVAEIKESVEILTRQRGDVGQSALLVSDFETATGEYTRLVNDEFSQAAKMVLDLNSAVITADGAYNLLPTIAGDVTIDNHNAWDVASAYYVTPRTGLYMVGMLFHIPELGTPAGATFKPHFRYDIGGTTSTPVSTNGTDAQPCLLTAVEMVPLNQGDIFKFELMVEHSAQPTTVTADVHAYLAEII